MKNFIAQIAARNDIEKQPALTPSNLINCQKQLQQNNIAPIPQAYLELLHFCNGLYVDGAWLAGIYPDTPQALDIYLLNLQVKHPLSRDIIILGADDFDYLAFNHKWQIYQIIDKDDLEVLEEYQQLEQVLNYFLKI